jgi:hypothetical protein
MGLAYASLAAAALLCWAEVVAGVFIEAGQATSCYPLRGGSGQDRAIPISQEGVL